MMHLIMLIAQPIWKSLTLLDAEEGGGVGGAKVAPHHSYAYTFKESIGGNSDNLCKFLNVKCLLGTLETTFKGNIRKKLSFQQLGT